ncbi:hypothetical protein O988_04340 [Pseudogymnoascus sp. VKM F-3808]|nr:hypothetical protein O988_04340 [Pseudogymnoascus sp. VKM F-3808]
MYAQPPAITSIFERSFTHDQIKINSFKLGELNSGRMYPTSLPEQREDRSSWNAPRTEPLSLSEQHKRGPYNIPPPDRSLGDESARPEISPRTTNGERLPPLSSLFSSTQAPLPARSPYSNPSPTFKPGSPESTARKASSNHLEQLQWDSSYRRPRSEPSGQYPYNQRSPHSVSSDRLPPPPRSVIDNRKPESPGYGDGASDYREAQYGRSSASSVRFSPGSEAASWRGYFPPMPKDQTSPYGHPRDQKTSPHIQLHEPDMRHSYAGSPQSHAMRNPYHQAPSVALSSGPTSPKDTLGPKIWTGTHFLPRFVRQAEVPGEGICYFYDDGTHCKTIIDGEHVNAHWGVTKAGKPRKRLAIACITCREKKIKCDPDYPRCVQCDKFGRVCKFKNAPRGGQGSPETPPADSEDAVTRSVSQLSELDGNKAEKRDLHYAPYHQGQRSPGSEIDENAPKRHRSAYDAYMPVKVDRADGNFNQVRYSPRQQPSPSPNYRSLDWLTRQATENPFETNEALSFELLDNFFLNTSCTTYRFLPEPHFRTWVADRSIKKSPQDIMLLYGLLALATVFSSADGAKLRGEEFAAVCRSAAEGSEFSLHLVQSRLLLSLYYVAINKYHESMDFCGSAIRVATWLGLNVELGESEKGSNSTIFNLDRAGYAECRRRTFWSCYIMDHFSTFCNGHLNTINPKDIFLRYPTTTKNFESLSGTSAPFFDPSGALAQSSLKDVGITAYMINILSIWGDVRDYNYRASKSHSVAVTEPFSSFYATTIARLEGWRASLLPSTENTLENLDSAVMDGTLGSFVSLHALYHVSYANLHRYGLHESEATPTLKSSLRTIYVHAKAVLDLGQNMATRGSRLSHSPASTTKFSSPYFGFIIVNAIDILSAKGRLADISAFHARVDGASKVVDELASFWHSARLQQDQIKARLDSLAALPLLTNGWNAANSALDASRGDAIVDAEKGTFEMRNSINSLSGRGARDNVYSATFEAWEDALKH